VFNIIGKPSGGQKEIESEYLFRKYMSSNHTQAQDLTEILLETEKKLGEMLNGG